MALAVAGALVVAPAWADVLVGTPGDDVLAGTPLADRVLAGDGADTLDGRGGRDALYGEAGDDTLLGGWDDDLLSGGVGNDLAVGGAGTDRLVLQGGDRAHGGPGDDTVAGRHGAYSARGGKGNDVLRASGAGTQLLHGDGGDDLLVFHGQRGDAGRAFGGRGDDRVSAEPDPTHAGTAALLSGGPGADELFGAASVLDGGAGNDHLTAWSTGPRRTHVRCGPGADVVVDAHPEDTIDADCEQVGVTIFASAGHTVTGTEHDDLVHDADGDETIATLGGDDYVASTYGGSDTVDLGAGDDVFAGGPRERGPDIDRITCGDGEDTVFAVQPHDVVAADCEHVR